MAYDAQSGQLILFGGISGGVMNDTWRWDGQNWTELHPTTSPSARQDSGLARDANGNLVLFGGALASGVAGDTWTWDGTNWLLHTPAMSPPPRRLGHLGYSPQLGAVILFGGIDASNAQLSDTWKWDGTTWLNVSSSFGPGSRNGHALAEGPNGDVVLFGDSDRNDTWSFGALPVNLNAVVSRKTHGSAGTFDVDLTSGSAIECRSGGSNGDYTLVFTFANTLASVGSATVSSGTGSVTSSNIDTTDGRGYILNLTGVTNAQVITVSLTNVTDSAGNFSSPVSASMGVLIGDVNASRRVDAADVSLVRQQTLQNVDASNFRGDINTSGRIDAADVSITRQQTLTSLP